MVFQLLVLLAGCWIVLYRRDRLLPSLGVLAVALAVMTLLGHFFLTPWLVLGGAAAVLLIPVIRRDHISRVILGIFRRVLPDMNRTEREALEAGDVWWDGDLFRGDPDWRRWLSYGQPRLTGDEQAFVDHQVETLCGMLNDWHIVNELKDLPPEAWDYIKREKFLGMIIPEEFGGLGFSALAHSTVVTKLATRCGAAAVDVMVPNSLGPAELLLHYGTDEQKQHYLPKLAVGNEIPCFALTAPAAGSDAGAIPDTGIICMGEHEGQETLGIRLTWNKRYITLAPVATVLGLAFKLFDPDSLLGDEENLGITVCLIPTCHPGVEIGNRHIPMNVPFMNGPTRGQDVFVPIDWIVGGAEYAGKGWRMLMECLAAGRAISLPGMGAASGIASYRMTGAYARVRQQFNTHIANFEGVEEALAQIAGEAYMLEATRVATASAVDLGLKPSVVSAIAKYHMTEAGRRAMTHAMDVHGGRGLIMGERNYLAQGYLSNPIGITVEGANILTRNLMIFGQGAIRCHPYVFNEMEAARNPDTDQGLADFDRNFFGHIGFIASNVVRTLSLGLTGARIAPRPVNGSMARYYQQLTRMSSALALASDVAMLSLGGELKRRERLSARLGDVLSQLYLASSVLRFYADGGCQPDELPYVHWNLQRSLYEIQRAFDDFLVNFPSRMIALILRGLIFPLGRRFSMPDDRLEHAMVKTMVSLSAVRERLTRASYVGSADDDVTGRVENAFIKVLAATEAEKKLQRGLRDGKLDKTQPRAELIETALKQGVLYSNDVELLQAADAARWDAIQVDDYSPAYIRNPLSYSIETTKHNAAKSRAA